MTAGRRLAWLGLVLVAALDWAALDDITTGRQPSFWMEWTFLLASVPILALLARLLLPRDVVGGAR